MDAADEASASRAACRETGEEIGLSHQRVVKASAGCPTG